jgi:hypothetical protein
VALAAELFLGAALLLGWTSWKMGWALHSQLRLSMHALDGIQHAGLIISPGDGMAWG